MDVFPKPIAPPGLTMKTTVHKTKSKFFVLLLISITVHKHKLTGIFLFPFYPSLSSSKYKHKTNRHLLFLPFIPACLYSSK